MQKTTRQIRVIIKRTFRLQPRIDLHYCFFFLITQLDRMKSAEEAGDNKMDIIDSIRYKHDLRAAITHHRRANEAIFAFWRAAASTEEQNSWQLSRLAEIFYTNLTSAEWYYKRLTLQVTHNRSGLLN